MFDVLAPSPARNPEVVLAEAVVLVQHGDLRVRAVPRDRLAVERPPTRSRGTSRPVTDTACVANQVEAPVAFRSCGTLSR